MTSWKPGEKYPEMLVPDATSVKGGKIEHLIPERPLLHVCCNRDHFGDVNVDIDPDVNPDVVADVTDFPGGLPFEDDSFAAAFADFPWVGSFKFPSTRAIKEMLRVAPVVYTISPWLYGCRIAHPDFIKVSWQPGIHDPILFVRYERKVHDVTQFPGYDKVTE